MPLKEFGEGLFSKAKRKMGHNIASFNSINRRPVENFNDTKGIGVEKEDRPKKK